MTDALSLLLAKHIRAEADALLAGAESEDPKVLDACDQLYALADGIENGTGMQAELRRRRATRAVAGSAGNVIRFPLASGADHKRERAAGKSTPPPLPEPAPASRCGLSPRFLDRSVVCRFVRKGFFHAGGRRGAIWGQRARAARRRVAARRGKRRAACGRWRRLRAKALRSRNIGRKGLNRARTRRRR